ncbi:Trafficking protein particle complex subunit 13 [Taenia solium]
MTFKLEALSRDIGTSRRKGRLTPTFMAPKDVWRLLYLTQPLNPGAAPAAGEVKLGHLDIAWRTTMGETGHLLTFPCESSTPHYSDVSLNIIKLPTQVAVEEPIQMACEITNRSSRVLELLLSRPETATTMAATTTASSSGSGTASETTAAAATMAAFPAFVWTGVTHQRLESLAPAASTQLSLEFVPVMTGLQVGPLI